MTHAPAQVRRFAPAIAGLAAALFLASCGQSQHGGFHGFPPAQVKRW